MLYSLQRFFWLAVDSIWSNLGMKGADYSIVRFMFGTKSNESIPDVIVRYCQKLEDAWYKCHVTVLNSKHPPSWSEHLFTSRLSTINIFTARTQYSRMRLFSVVTSHSVSVTGHIRHSWNLFYVTTYIHQVNSDHREKTHSAVVTVQLSKHGSSDRRDWSRQSG